MEFRIWNLNSKDSKHLNMLKKKAGVLGVMVPQQKLEISSLKKDYVTTLSSS